MGGQGNPFPKDCCHRSDSATPSPWDTRGAGDPPQGRAPARSSPSAGWIILSSSQSGTQAQADKATDGKGQGAGQELHPEPPVWLPQGLRPGAPQPQTSPALAPDCSTSGWALGPAAISPAVWARNRAMEQCCPCPTLRWGRGALLTKAPLPALLFSFFFSPF